MQRADGPQPHRQVGRVILEHFGGAELSIEMVDEPAGRAHLQNFLTGRAMAGVNRVVISHGKMWIGGVGWMKVGKRWSDRRDRAAGFEGRR
ncbi:hypothetical protein ACVIWU_006769 [Bradyrhizobium sp. USDA 4509]